MPNKPDEGHDHRLGEASSTPRVEASSTPRVEGVTISAGGVPIGRVAKWSVARAPLYSTFGQGVAFDMQPTNVFDVVPGSVGPITIDIRRLDFPPREHPLTFAPMPEPDVGVPPEYGPESRLVKTGATFEYTRRVDAGTDDRATPVPPKGGPA